MKQIIVDIDGTLADMEWRRKFLEGEEEDWESFYEGIPEDGVNDWCLEIVERFKEDHLIVLVTGREGTEDIREDTIEWLDKNKIDYDELHMRGEKDYRPDNEVKKEIFEEELADRDTLFVIDDRKQVVDMWRNELGLTVLHCAEGDF